MSKETFDADVVAELVCSCVNYARRGVAGGIPAFRDASYSHGGEFTIETVSGELFAVKVERAGRG